MRASLIESGAPRRGARMNFGINILPSFGPRTAHRGHTMHSAAVAGSAHDALGYHSIKTVEHFVSTITSASPNPCVFLSAVGQARTGAWRLVTGAVIPGFHHPASPRASDLACSTT